jgi:hypothetical protein
MLFKNVNYVTGCVKRNGEFDIQSIKISVFHPSKIEIEFLLTNDKNRKLYFNYTGDYSHYMVSFFFRIKKKISRNMAIYLINYIIYNHWTLSLVKYNYLKDNIYYSLEYSQEIYINKFDI